VEFVQPFSALSLRDLRRWQMPEREWVVEGLIPTGSLSLLSGREKAGKSLFLIDLVTSVATGEPFLERETRAGPAGLLFLEDHPGDVRDRIDKRIPARDDSPLYFLPADGSLEDLRFSLTDDDSLARLEETVTFYKLRLLAIDPLRETHNLAENDADQMAPVIRPLRQLAHHLNVAIVLAHHQNKAGESRGSTAIRASVDQELHWSVDEEAAELSGKLRVMGRCGPKQVIPARFGDGGRFEVGECAGVKPAELSVQGRIVAVLEASTGEMDAYALWEAVNADGQAARSLGSVQNAVTVLVREGKLRARGVGSVVEPRRYSLVDPWDVEADRRTGGKEQGVGKAAADGLRRERGAG
jgi:hypothetical protein